MPRSASFIGSLWVLCSLAGPLRPNLNPLIPLRYIRFIDDSGSSVLNLPAEPEPLLVAPISQELNLTPEGRSVFTAKLPLQTLVWIFSPSAVVQYMLTYLFPQPHLPEAYGSPGTSSTDIPSVAPDCPAEPEELDPASVVEINIMDERIGSYSGKKSSLFELLGGRRDLLELYLAERPGFRVRYEAGTGFLEGASLVRYTEEEVKDRESRDKFRARVSRRYRPGEEIEAQDCRTGVELLSFIINLDSAAELPQDLAISQNKPKIGSLDCAIKSFVSNSGSAAELPQDLAIFCIRSLLCRETLANAIRQNPRIISDLPADFYFPRLLELGQKATLYTLGPAGGRYLAHKKANGFISLFYEDGTMPISIKYGYGYDDLRRRHQDSGLDYLKEQRIGEQEPYKNILDCIGELCLRRMWYDYDTRLLGEPRARALLEFVVYMCVRATEDGNSRDSSARIYTSATSGKLSVSLSLPYGEDEVPYFDTERQSDHFDLDFDRTSKIIQAKYYHDYWYTLEDTDNGGCMSCIMKAQFKVRKISPEFNKLFGL